MAVRRVHDQWLQLPHQLLAAACGERRAHPHVLERPFASYSPSSSEPTTGPLLWKRYPATTTSAVRSCLTLYMTRASGR